MKLNGVMLGSENPKALAEFYTLAFGEPGWGQDDWFGYLIGTGSIMIGPHSDIKGNNENPARIMMALETGDPKQEFERLTGLGAKVVAEPYQPDEQNSPDIWLATVADPDGNYLQLASPWKE